VRLGWFRSLRGGWIRIRIGGGWTRSGRDDDDDDDVRQGLGIGRNRR
jgi:hypothetical protein